MQQILKSLLVFLPFATLGAQQVLSPADTMKLRRYEDTLLALSYAVLHDTLPERRFAACKRTITTLVRALEVPASFEWPFHRLKSISIQYPPDSTFRIFTWQLDKGDGSFRQYGAIQMRRSDLALYPLIDRSHELLWPEGEVLPADQWYGAIYYHIEPFQGPDQQQMYVLFGFDAHSPYQHRKVADVLWFDTEGRPRFGAPVFVKDGPQDTQVWHRLLLEYWTEASVRLNYDPQLDIIIFDYLQPISRTVPTQGKILTWIPDGTYEGFRLEADGRWHHIPKVFHQTLDRPPISEEARPSDKRDILGRRIRRKH